MVEATQVIQWWSDSQIWANIATVVTGLTAIVMVIFSWVQLRAAREENKKAHDALVTANMALDRAEQIERSMEELHYYAFLSDEGGTKSTFSGLILVAGELEKLGSPNGGTLHEVFQKNRDDAVKRYDDFKSKRGAELGIE